MDVANQQNPSVNGPAQLWGRHNGIESGGRSEGVVGDALGCLPRAYYEEPSLRPGTPIGIVGCDHHQLAAIGRPRQGADAVEFSRRTRRLSAAHGHDI